MDYLMCDLIERWMDGLKDFWFDGGLDGLIDG